MIDDRAADVRNGVAVGNQELKRKRPGVSGVRLRSRSSYSACRSAASWASRASEKQAIVVGDPVTNWTAEVCSGGWVTRPPRIRRLSSAFWRGKTEFTMRDGHHRIPA